MNKKKKTKIPKVIHYVWFGGKEKPPRIKKIMNTWKKLKPEYEFKEWNESNFDINKCKFVKKAFEEKKWAFISDYIRFWAVYNYGGIYFDTDVLVRKNLDDFLDYDAFVGFESVGYPFTAVFGAVKHHPFSKKVLDMYDNMDFKYKHIDELINTPMIVDILVNNFGCQKNLNKRQILKNNILVVPDNILCNPSLKSKTIHVFSGSWSDKRIKKMFPVRVRDFLRNRTFTNFGIIMYNLVRGVFFAPIAPFVLKKINKSINSQKVILDKENEKI